MKKNSGKILNITVVLFYFLISMLFCLSALFPSHLHVGEGSDFYIHKLFGIDRKYFLIFSINSLMSSLSLMFCWFFVRKNLKFWLLSFAFIILFVNILIPFLYNFVGLGAVFDDSYMFVRYAKNIASGNGYSWNPDGINSYGATSITYTFFVVLILWLFKGLSSQIILVTSSTIFLLLFVLVQQKILLNNLKNQILKDYSFPILCFWVFSGIFSLVSVHAFTGMDTTMAIFSNTVLILATLHAGKQKSITSLSIVALCAYFTFLTRPDNGIYAALFPVLYLYMNIEDKSVRSVLIFIVMFFFMLVIDSVVKHYVFGDVLPLTFYAKQNSFLEAYFDKYKWRPVEYLASMFLYIFPCILICILFAKKQFLRIILPFTLPALLTYLYFFHVVQIMGFYARFYIPAIPFFLTLLFLLMDENLQKGKSLRNCLKERKFYIVMVLVVFCISWYLLRITFDSFERDNIAYIKQSYEITEEDHTKGDNNFEFIFSLVDQLPSGSNVAASEYGRLAAHRPDINIIDLVGLHSVYIAKKGFDDNYLITTNPNVIFMVPKSYTKLYNSIINSRVFIEEYKFYPDVASLGVAIRKDNEDIIEFVEQYLEKIHEN